MVYYLISGFSVLSLLAAYFYRRNVLSWSVDQGATAQESKQLHFLHKAIRDGAMSFLNQEYRYMLVFMLTFAVLIGVLIDDPHTQIHEGWYTALSFLAGSLISILAGNIGMRIATEGNVRTTSAARSSLATAFNIALRSGAVMGFGLVGLACLGLFLVYLGFQAWLPELLPTALMEIVAGFGLGGSAIALFGRVGGGIYTKAADVGADLVGKVEQGIPEDDPRNPAVIADNVGDNVGDVAGMGSDLFGSCAESTCAAMVIGALAFVGNINAMLLPIAVTAVSIPISLLVLQIVRVRVEADVSTALKRLLLYSTVLLAAAMYFLFEWALPKNFSINGSEYTSFGIYICYLSGLLSGLLIGLLTEYFTSHQFKPVRELAKSCETGAATNIIFGLALGFRSTAESILAISIAIFVSFNFGGMYGVAIAALGMLGTLVIGLTIDAYGPVADNAGGIAEMAGLGEETRKRTDILDSAGNTTAAIGKGLAIGSAILTSLALFAAFLTSAQQHSGMVISIDLLNPWVLTGLFIGTILPFLFTSWTMKAVGRAAFDMVEEVRRQFKQNPNIMKGIDKPDYKACVAISTQAALREMIAPGLLILLSPLTVGFLFGIEALAGLLFGSLLISTGLAIAQSNAGGAWDNAKKYIETGKLGGKGSDTHKASVVGDTVGDPLKDTSGPSLNILMKLSAILSLVFVPFFVEHGGLLIF